MSNPNGELSSHNKIENLKRSISLDLAALGDIAATGNEDAARAIYESAAWALYEFDLICEHMPKVIEPIARKEAVLPGWLTCNVNQKRLNETRIKDLNLGLDGELDYLGKYSTNAIATRIALRLYVTVKVGREDWLKRDEYRHRITQLKKKYPSIAKQRPPAPPLDQKLAAEFRLRDETRRLARYLQPMTKQNCKQWFKAAWPAFLAMYGAEFQGLKQFDSFWKPYEKITNPKEVAKGKRPTVERDTKDRGRVRGDIKKAIEQAFESIAPIG